MLTDRAIAALKPKAEEYRVTDAKGLFLVVTPTGLKVWRTIYTRAGRRHLVKLGQYPEMSLTEARLARAMIRRDVAAGADPAQEAAGARRRQQEANTHTLEAMARAWHTRMTQRKWAKSYGDQVLQRLETHVFPRIGAMPVALIRRRDIVELLEAAAERSGAFQAKNTRQHLSCLFDDLILRDVVDANPAARLHKVTETPATERQPAVVTIEEAREVLAKLEASSCSVMLKLMHRFTALTGLRPSEVREAQWSEIQGDVWRIPAARMKGRRDRKQAHTVFLSPGAQDVLAVARTLARPGAAYVFPSQHVGHRHQPYDRASLTRQLTLALGPRVQVAHGWRATMATILTVRHPEARDLVQVMLAHQIQGQVARLYNRSDEVMYEPRIRPLAHEWAELLLEGAPSAWQLAGLPAPEGSNVVPMLGRAA